MVVDIWKAILISTSHYEFAGCPVPLCAMIFYSRVASSRKYRSTRYHSPSRISQVSILEHSISLGDMDIRVQELQVPDSWVLVSQICRLLSQDQYAKLAAPAWHPSNSPLLTHYNHLCSSLVPSFNTHHQPKSHSVPSLGRTHRVSTPIFQPPPHSQSPLRNPPFDFPTLANPPYPGPSIPPTHSLLLSSYTHINPERNYFAATIAAQTAIFNAYLASSDTVVPQNVIEYSFYAVRVKPREPTKVK